ncbi:DNA-binding IclR family transcriptional regulator [Microbacterium natoriense]|uniref:DNA-binding IclR family transcriptional regulator n=1 Tax=Microbacterium natoriense TaxID=284570 RepID=A0AAW8ESK9_9MICO|nr:IclR family transcriptional regulator [Microbacterium natoriense]MDQ0646223.1 DNA-binding IclR family transcriptional regulator [Microbacterium natoriense]
MTDPTVVERGTVGALDRAIRILDELAAAPGGLDLASIAQSVGMSSSGAHRALKSLSLGGLVSQRERRGDYFLGPKILVWAQQMGDERSLASLAMPILRVLNEETRESVYLSVMRDRRIWNICALEGHGNVLVQERPGAERLFHSTGRGKLFLASLDRAAAKKIVAETSLPSVGPATITDEAELWREVDRARERGFAVSREESFAGGAGVAFPVFDNRGVLLAAVGASIPLTRFDSLGEQFFVEQVRHAAEKITAAWAGVHMLDNT